MTSSDPASVIILAPKPIRLSGSSTNPFARPRPARLPTDAFARIKLNDDEPVVSPPATTTTTTATTVSESPQPTPHDADDSGDSRPYMLAPEALEEFLAILRPALRSPSSRTRRHNHSQHHHHHHHQQQSNVSSITLPLLSSATSPVHAYERPHPYKRDSTKPRSGPSSVSSHSSDTTPPDPTSVTERAKKNKHRATGSGAGSPETQSLTVDSDSWRAHSALLASPISRSQAGNPLPRHPSYETLSSNLIFHFQPSPEVNRPTADQLLLCPPTPESPLVLATPPKDATTAAEAMETS